MPDAELRYSLNAVKRAGKEMRDGTKSPEAFLSDLEIFENWQACHSYPLNWFYDSLSQFAQRINPPPNVVQRRKRLDAVVRKLKDNPHVQLTTMQDIAGCRAIVNTIRSLDPFVTVCREGWLDHELYDIDDRILKPKPTGYRSVHLIYRFKSENKSFDGRFVEVQFRSGLQHTWATAVEIVDLFQRQTLKAGTGDPKWQRFFALMASAIARLESSPPVPHTPSGMELENELRHHAETLNVQRQMIAYSSLANSVQSSYVGVSGYSGYGKSGFFVMELDPTLQKIDVRGYRQQEFRKAYLDVAQAEKSNPNVVLVAASDLVSLKEAYPNWIIDTNTFLLVLRLILNRAMNIL
jgi:ppGpp synthetase/RelA/SpoT-type nucleotidyltranferase